MKLYLYTLGCKVNAIETDSIAALLVCHGYTVCDTPGEADVIVLNSCTVTASGDKRMLHTLRRLRTAAPAACLVLTGCYAQAFPAQAASLPGADIVTGTHGRAHLPELISRWMQDHTHITDVTAYSGSTVFEPLPQGTDTAHTRAFLKIQDGCSRYCAYCIIPYARGNARSKPLAVLAQEAQELYNAGYAEIVLCGINLACYGQESGQSLPDAAEACAAAGFPRIRLGSLEPDGLTDAVLMRLAAVQGLCPQFHISVQSGCDRTLAAMRRHYTCAEYAALVEKIRILFPGAAVTTDIMTGFPGETEADFAETLRFAEEMGFAQMHVFRYSPRPGTAAAAFPEQIPEEVKRARADRLNALADRLHTAFLERCMGQIHSVLFERERSSGFHTGHAENYAVVQVPVQDGDDSWRGSIREVSITGMYNGKLTGIAPL